MAGRRQPAALTLALAALAGCGGANTAGAGGAGMGGSTGADGDPNDPDPVLTSEARAALMALHADDGPPPPDPSNRVADAPAARLFGQRLFFDPRFSGRLLEGDNDGSAPTLGARGDAGKVSCAGCHLPAAGFVDTRSPHAQVSLAAQWTLRRTPTLLEIGFAPLFNWDGRRDGLWNQALGVMESNREFNSGRLFVAEQVFRNHRAEYEAIFGALPPLDDSARFPALTPETTGCVEVSTPAGSKFTCRGLPGDGADYDGLAPGDQTLVTQVAVNASKAIAAYLRLLRCGAGRFDRWLDGDATALTRAEQRGAALFVGRANCVSCHGGPRLSDGQFHNVGLSPAVVAVAIHDVDDHGAATGIAAALTDPLGTAGAFSDGDRHALPAATTAAMDGAFRTPTLRCSSQQPSFMHTAQMSALDQVVAFFNRGGDRVGGYPGTSELRPLGLTARERADLVAFIGALDGPGPAAPLRGAP
ncbi:MAG TPA: cytochrome c peroxidase [Polyangia bacterium]|jgi:cytochrome c peroxidase|nr:cytochrome c peroxidase [Polyangia bacterium]